MLRILSRHGRCCFHPRDMSFVSSKVVLHHLKLMLRRPHSLVPTTRCAGTLADDLPGLLTLAGRARAELEELQGRQGDTSAQGEHGRRISELSQIVSLLDRLEAADEERGQLQQLQAEPELRQMALEEEQALTQRTQELTEALEERLAAPPPEDACSAMLEITAGVGGQEAMLFTSELLDMYLQYAAARGWRPEMAACDTTDLGGVRYAALTVHGGDVYGRLQHEAGVHRVQRVPRTERSGRLHTSTAAVAVLALPEPVQVALPASDLRVETKRASGAGGQHVNTTDSAVRVVHLPTGLAVECQRERSQHRNKERALEILRARLFQAQLDRQQQERAAARRQQVGDSGRAEKVRTYNFPQDRVTDHRCGVSLHCLAEVLSGRRLDPFIDALCEQRRRHTLMERLQEVGARPT